MIKYAIIKDDFIFAGFGCLGEPKWYGMVTSASWMMYNHTLEAENALRALNHDGRIIKITIDNNILKLCKYSVKENRRGYRKN